MITQPIARTESESILGLFMTMINEHDFPPLPSQAKKRRIAINHGAASHAPVSISREVHTSLNDLPDELIVEILGYLPGINIDDFPYPAVPKRHAYRALSTLSALARTSRRLNRLVIGQLYAKYDNRFCEPYLFLRTVVSNPRLAGLVRDADFRFDRARYGYGPGRYAPTAKDKKVIKEGLRAICDPDWKSRATACNQNRGSDEVVYSAILLCTPNITSTSYEKRVEAIYLPPQWLYMVAKAAEGAYGGIHRFEHLRSIKVDVLASDLIKFIALFRLQSLRKIHLCAVAEYEKGPASASIRSTDKNARELERRIPPTSNNLEELILERCIYSELCLDVLVSSSRRLKTFEYNADLGQEWGRESPTPDRSKTIVDILRRHETSLETLRIFADEQVEDMEPDRIHLHDNMTSFTSLREIDCPVAMIALRADDMFAERLPSSLLKFTTHIRADTDDERRIDSLKHMVANCESHTPRLREVWVFQQPFGAFDCEEFVGLASEAGVRLIWQVSDDAMDDSTDGFVTGSSSSLEEPFDSDY